MSDDVLFATDQDIVLEPDQIRSVAPLLVELDVAGPVRIRDLGDRIGGGPFLAPALLNAAMFGEFDGLRDLARGLPLQSQNDPRWTWKLEELQQMESHAVPSYAEASESTRPTAMCIDPGVLRLQNRELGRVLTFAASLHPHVSPDFQRALIPRLRGFPPDVVRGLAPLLQVRSPLAEPPDLATWNGPSRRTRDMPWREISEAAAHGHEVVSVASEQALWQIESEHLPAVATVKVGRTPIRVHIFDVVEACNG